MTSQGQGLCLAWPSVCEASVRQLSWQKGTDGHCNLSPDNEWILTDTYPDAYQLKKAQSPFPRREEKSLRRVLHDSSGRFWWRSGAENLFICSAITGKAARDQAPPAAICIHTGTASDVISSLTPLTRIP